MLNLKNLFERTGQLFVTELRQNIERQTDIDGQRMKPVKPSTAKARQRAKGLGRGLAVRWVQGKVKGLKTLQKSGHAKSISVPLTRLLFTGRFKQNAFKFQAAERFVRIFVNRNYYHSEEATGGRSLVTYRDIVAYNQKGSPEINPNIQSPPLIFPSQMKDVSQMKAVESFKRLVRQETQNIQNQIIGGGLKIRNEILL